HVFCFKCIHKWTKNESTCPVCRVQVRSITKTLSLKEIEQFNVRAPVSASPSHPWHGGG
ncbi:unnamed protein product, partial [Ectocarpus fasciculatus]